MKLSRYHGVSETNLTYSNNGTLVLDLGYYALLITDGKPYIMEVSPRGGGNRLSEIL